MSNVTELPNLAERLAKIEESATRGGGPPYDGGMEARVAKLEEFAQDTRDRLVRIETRLDTFATKEDMHRELHSLTWKMIGAQAALVAAVYFVVKFLH